MSHRKIDHSTEPVPSAGRASAAHLGETCPQRRARAETVLARYPELNPDELAELLHWYRREASAMDVALVASNERLRERFHRFHIEHAARFSWKEKAFATLLALGTLSLVAFGLNAGGVMTAPETRAAASGRPPILLAEPEAEALFDLALTWRTRHPLAAGLLLEELDRAATVPPGLLPQDVVTMESHVVFVDRASGGSHSVQLVYPSRADMAEHRVSVLTPIGAALIGLRRGAAIDWPNRQGELRRLEIVEVIQPAPRERAA